MEQQNNQRENLSYLSPPTVHEDSKSHAMSLGYDFYAAAESISGEGWYFRISKPTHDNVKMEYQLQQHCQCMFGTYIQATQENNPKNTQAPRTIDAIYLRPLNNIQGGHKVMNLPTGAVMMRHRVREQLATKMVIKAVEDMAE